MGVVALVASAASARAEPAIVGEVSGQPDRAIRFRAFDGLPRSHASGDHRFDRLAGDRPQITATLELTGLSGLLVRSWTQPRTPRAKRERDLDDFARRFAFEFSPPLPVEMRTGRVHR